MPRTPLPELSAALADRYRVERVLGSGATATVYLAHDLKHRRTVAIKVLQPELSAAVGRERFFREIELMAGLQHPHILPLFDSGETANPRDPAAPGLLFYVMPYVEGDSLRARLRRERQLSIEDALAITRQVADALTYASARGVVHRDIKPENVLLRRAEAGDSGGVGAVHALVADFGIARELAESGDDRLTGSGVTLGTPAYMSPEQASGDAEVDGRADVYALACVLYEMLAGEPPFTGPTVRSVVSKHLTEPPPDVRQARDRVPEHVATAITRALSKVRADRFTTARQFVDALGKPSDWVATTSLPGAGTLSRRPEAGRGRVTVVAMVAGAVVIAALIAVGLDVGGVRSRLTGALPGASARAVGERSVAVLPFHNVSGNADDEYFSDGLTEELIAALSQVRAVRVAARTSAFAFKGQDRDVREVARTLNVGTVLVGSVRKSADRIRVTAQLIDASTGLDLWSETYDERQLADVFDIQADMARRIAHALEASLTPREAQRLGTKPTDDLEAYTLYLKGRFYFNKRGAELDTAIEYFNRAIAIDSQYARAYAGLASAYGPLGVHGYIRPREGREHMRQAVYRALDLDDELAEAHTALGAYLHVYEWDWEGAEREFRRAIELDRNYPTAHLWYGHFLENMGRFDEGLTERRLAEALDPLVPSVGVGSALGLTGRYDLARASYLQALELDPNYWQAHESLGDLFIVQREFKAAVASFQRAVETSGASSRTKAGLARALALSGRVPEARAILRSIQEDTLAREIQHPTVAAAFIAVGDTAAAFEWLEGSFHQRHPAMTAIDVHLAYARMRSHPRFQDLVRRVGFPRTRQR